MHACTHTHTNMYTHWHISNWNVLWEFPCGGSMIQLTIIHFNTHTHSSVSDAYTVCSLLQCRETILFFGLWSKNTYIPVFLFVVLSVWQLLLPLNLWNFLLFQFSWLGAVKIKQKTQSKSQTSYFQSNHCCFCYHKRSNVTSEYNVSLNKTAMDNH